MKSRAEYSWFSVLNPNSKASVKLFCFPYAGGGTAIFRKWPGLLPPAIEVLPAYLPGRESRMKEARFTDLRPLVEAIAEAILPHLDRPFAFFGHSMGGTIGYELARALRSRHQLEPVRLFISGRRAPQIPPKSPATYDLPEDEFVETLRSLNGIPGEVLDNRELMQLVMPLLRADFEICQTYDYIPGEPLTCPITVLGGLQDVEVPREDLNAWKEQTTSTCSVCMFPGDHFFINTSQLQILRVIARDLYQHANVMQPVWWEHAR